QHLVVRRDAHQRAQVALGLLVDAHVLLAAMAHFHHRLAAAVPVEHLGGSLREHFLGQHRRPGAEVEHLSHRRPPVGESGILACRRRRSGLREVNRLQRRRRDNGRAAGPTGSRAFAPGRRLRRIQTMPSPSVTTVADAARLVDALRARLQASTGREVRVFETHISWVLLDGTHAWKLKKPVRLGFLDFAELPTRRRFCDEELRLNRRLAPQLYLDVVPIAGSVDAPRLGGDGDAIEYAVKMREFAPGALFSERLEAGTLAPAHLGRLAQRLSAFHDAAPVAAADIGYGSAERIEADTAQVLDGLAPRVGAATIADLRERLTGQARALRDTFERRRSAGRVREGHGDLHLANAVVLGE